ncbi:MULTISPECIES: DUF6722 family protein [Parabacteroides]|jgi:hypothetical protein|uniref:DUF6722 family protein n=1 Tax=Parabacteroides TaxID=375288 RepID=UPI001CA3B2B3|nr:DUF6722 family protein [Parabacteroides acidifaciens]
MSKIPAKQVYYTKKTSLRKNRRLLKAIYLEISKYGLDLSKLVFAGVILVNIMSLDVNKFFIFVLGTIAVTLLACISFILFIKGKE